MILRATLHHPGKTAALNRHTKNKKKKKKKQKKKKKNRKKKKKKKKKSRPCTPRRTGGAPGVGQASNQASFFFRAFCDAVSYALSAVHRTWAALRMAVHVSADCENVSVMDHMLD